MRSRRPFLSRLSSSAGDGRRVVDGSTLRAPGVQFPNIAQHLVSDLEQTVRLVDFRRGRPAPEHSRAK